MAQKKSSSGKISNGGRREAHKRQEEKRQAKFAAKRENGTAYKWKPNPYKKGTDEWLEEEVKRANKKNSKSRCEYARLTSIFAKLQNQLDKERLANKNAEKKNK